MKKTYFLALVAAISFSAIVQAQNIIGRFDYDSLYAPNVLCTYGTYTNFNNYTSTHPGPYANVGVIDYGPNSYGGFSSQQCSRHTVHTDTSKRDSLSNYTLRCIPQGKSSSVRLGCAYGSYYCQAIAYNILVDTSLSDMLRIDFATVMYNPGHPVSQGPRMYLEIIDNNTGAQAGFMNFTVASPSASGSATNLNLSWIPGISNGYEYLDWNPVGINISHFHGRSITLRITTFNCGQGAMAHCGYAYYTVDYGNMALTTIPIVAKSNDITFHAPDGFMKYEWRLDNSPSTIFDSLQTVAIPIGQTFTCTMTDYHGNTKVIHSKSAPRRPHSDFTYIISHPDANTNIINLTNLSTLIDTTTQTPLAELEDFHWIIDTNNLCYQLNPVFEVDTGWHTVSLITKSGSTAMSDTMTRNIYVSSSVAITTTESPELKIYPNPVKDRIYINGKNIEKVEVIDHIGRIAMVEYGKNDINVAKLPAGNYILRMQTNDGQLVLRNFVKQ